jgi:hypothetical protein
MGRILQKVLWIAIAETLGVILLAVLNPFDIVTYTTARSHDQWEQIAGASYEPTPRRNVPPGVGRAYQDGDARDQITIISLSDETLVGTGIKRPLVWSNHEAILDSVAFQPALAHAGKPPPVAIFVDFVLAGGAVGSQSFEPPKTKDDTDKLLNACQSAAGLSMDRFQCYVAKVAEVTHYWTWASDPQCQATPLAKIDCILKPIPPDKKGGIPVIFADARPRTGGPADPVLTALGKVAILAPAEVSANDGYWLASPQRSADRENVDFTLSPAAALYAAYCRQARCQRSPMVDPPSIRPRDDLRPQRAEWSRAFDSPVDIAWGVGGPDYFTDMLRYFHPGAFGQHCQIQRPDAFSVVLRVAGHAISGLLNQGSKLPCAYAHDLPYADLDQGAMTFEQLTTALSGKVVLIGGEFTDSNDFVPTPFHYQLPGVYDHAMALDNLIQGDFRGVAYSRVDPPLTPLAIGKGDLKNFGFTFIFSLFTSLVLVTLNTIAIEEAGTSRLRHLAKPERLVVFALYMVGVPVLAFYVAIANPLQVQYYNIALLFILWIGAVPLILHAYLKPSSLLLQRAEAALRSLDLREAHWGDTPPRKRPAKRKPKAPPPPTPQHPLT